MSTSGVTPAAERLWLGIRCFLTKSKLMSPSAMFSIVAVLMLVACTSASLCFGERELRGGAEGRNMTAKQFSSLLSLNLTPAQQSTRELPLEQHRHL